MTRTPDIFRANSKAARVLRWMVFHGEVSSADFKAAHVALGGTTLSTHAFDRYFSGNGRYTPFDGGYGVLQRTERVGNPSIGISRPQRCVRWLGSEGATFEERASNWLQRVALKMPMPTMRLDAAFVICRDNRDDSVEAAWCAAIRRKLVTGTEYLAPTVPRHRLLKMLTDAEIEDWHGYCETQAVDAGHSDEVRESAEQWLSAVRINLAHRERQYWARKGAA